MVSLSEMFNQGIALNALGWILGLSIISILVWFFYRSISKMNLIELNLKKYNYSEHPIGKKFVAIGLYFLEYIIVIPVLIALWFVGVAIAFYFMGGKVEYALFVTVVLIGAIRVLAFYNSEISIELAKLFPFVAISTFLLSPSRNYSGEIIGLFFEQFSNFSLIFDDIFSYVVVIFCIEIFLRFIYTMYEFWESEEGETFNPRE